MAQQRRRVSPPYQPRAHIHPGTTAAKGLAALPDGGIPFYGHDGGERVLPPYQTVARVPTGTLAEQTLGPPPASYTFPLGTAAAKGLAALPDGGAPFHGRVGRASSFAKATEDKDARPSHGIVHFLPRHNSGEGSRRPTGRWRDFLRAPWPSILLRQGYGGQGRSALPHGTTVANGLAALPAGGKPSRRLGPSRAISGRGADGPGFWRRPCHLWPWRRPWRCRRTSCRGTGCSCPPGRGRVRA